MIKGAFYLVILLFYQIYKKQNNKITKINEGRGKKKEKENVERFF